MTPIQFATSYFNPRILFSGQIRHAFNTTWARGACAIGAGTFFLYAAKKVRDHLNSFHPSQDTPQMVQTYLRLLPLRNIWFYQRKWDDLKTFFTSHKDEIFQALLLQQIEQPEKDILTPFFELSLPEKESINLQAYANDLSKSLQNPLKGEGISSQLYHLATSLLFYLSRASLTFIATFLRAHDFSQKENTSLISRPEAMMHLSSFYTMIEKPILLLWALLTFLQTQTDSKVVQYGTLVTAFLGGLSLIKFFLSVEKTKDTTLHNEMRNLTADEKAGKLPLIMGRTDEVIKMARCFSPLNEDSLSVLLIAPSGAGKDAIVHAFIDAINKGYFPDLEGVQVSTVGTSELSEPGGGTSNTYLSRLQILTRDLEGKGHKNIIFCNEIHTLNSKKEGWGADLGQQFKTFIENGSIHVIGATTEAEYKQHLEEDKPLMRRFKPIFVKPLDEAQCKIPLKNYLARQYPSVEVEDGAITEAFKITNSQSPEIAQPAKAKQLLIESVRSVVGNFNKQLTQLVESSTQLSALKTELTADPTNVDKAKKTADLTKEVEEIKTSLAAERNNTLSKLKRYRSVVQKRLIHLAHQSSLQNLAKTRLILQKIDSEIKKLDVRITAETVQSVAQKSVQPMAEKAA